ncbi:MAG: acyl-CoA thioesterase [Clostridia bacterium]|nr:acyl-CoA thioesterase [Clostridia bacterium]MBR0027035.1 acyl-CoA thioesterase [Clostridia bacterium]
MAKKTKTMKDSFTVLAQVVLPMQANPAGNVHGGEIIKMMDSTAGVAAQKHAHTNCVTARIEEINFKKPIHIGELVTCKAQVIYTGRSSMEVFVTVESENLISGKQQIALTAFFTMVSLDKNGKPSGVQGLDLENASEYEKKLYKEGEKRYLMHSSRKK